MPRRLPPDILGRWERCLDDVERSGVRNPYAVCTATFKRAYGPAFLRWRARRRVAARRSYDNPSPRSSGTASIATRRKIVAGTTDALQPYFSRPRSLATRLAHAYEHLNQVSLSELYERSRRRGGPHMPHDFGHLLGSLSIDPRPARHLRFELRVPTVGWDVSP